MTSDSGPERKFWQIALADLDRQLGSSPNGLASDEAAARRLRYGPNKLRIFWNSAKREQGLGRFGGAIDRQRC
jgi:hypothetical protein